MKIKGFKDTIKWYDKNAKYYAKATLSDNATDQINEFLSNIPKGGKILDAGCGGGRDTNIFAEEGYNAVGIDISSGLLKEAKSRYPHIKFIKGDFLDLPFSNNTFAGVWAHASLVHLETVDDVEKALSEFRRVLKQGGTIHILVKAQKGKDKTAVVTDKLSKHNRFFQYFTKREIEGLLTKQEFRIIKMDQYKETDTNPKGRSEVEWILALAKK